jgi:hypothetical protein
MDYRGEAKFFQGGVLALHDPCHDENTDADAGLAEGYAFGDGTDGKPFGAFIAEDARHLWRTVAISICLDDAEDRCGASRVTDEAVVSGDTRSRDFDPTALHKFLRRTSY